jgi:hypothetical protein
MARARQASHNAPAVIPPQGRLTLTTATPVMTAEAANQTTIYYTPYVGDRVPLYNGTEWENKLFSELSIAMAASANWAADSNFDLFVANDGGTIRLVTGPAWTSGTARGTGAGTTELERKNGIWTNKVSMTGRYGASSTMTVDANEGTYVGTFRTTGSTGTTTWELGGLADGGNPIVLLLWNMYNRVPVKAVNNDTTDNWTYTTLTLRKKNDNANNQVQIVQGLNEPVEVKNIALFLNSSAAVSSYTPIALDSLTVAATTQINIVNTATSTAYGAGFAMFSDYPGLGYHYFQALEQSNASGVQTFYGDNGGGYVQSGMTFSGMF